MKHRNPTPVPSSCDETQLRLAKAMRRIPAIPPDWIMKGDVPIISHHHSATRDKPKWLRLFSALLPYLWSVVNQMK